MRAVAIVAYIVASIAFLCNICVLIKVRNFQNFFERILFSKHLILTLFNLSNLPYIWVENIPLCDIFGGLFFYCFLANVISVNILSLEYYRIVKNPNLEQFLRKYSEIIIFSLPLFMFIPLLCMDRPIGRYPAYCEGNTNGSATNLAFELYYNLGTWCLLFGGGIFIFRILLSEISRGAFGGDKVFYHPVLVLASYYLATLLPELPSVLYTLVKFITPITLTDNDNIGLRMAFFFVSIGDLIISMNTYPFSEHEIETGVFDLSIVQDIARSREVSRASVLSRLSQVSGARFSSNPQINSISEIQMGKDSNISQISRESELSRSESESSEKYENPIHRHLI
jgi:hypothetical protein